jgi:hypothetical protein
MKLRSNKPAVLAALAAGTILGGWPDRITNGVAIEDKRGGDILSASQIACHEWLKKVTGRYPLIHYTDKHLKLHVFRSYKEFYKWRAKDWTHAAEYPSGEENRARQVRHKARRKAERFLADALIEYVSLRKEDK